MTFDPFRQFRNNILIKSDSTDLGSNARMNRAETGLAFRVLSYAFSRSPCFLRPLDLEKLSSHTNAEDGLRLCVRTVRLLTVINVYPLVSVANGFPFLNAERSCVSQNGFESSGSSGGSHSHKKRNLTRPPRNISRVTCVFTPRLDSVLGEARWGRET